jgi:hypothetical protein
MASEDFFLTLCPDPLYLDLLCLDPGCVKAIEKIEKGLRLHLNPESEILLLLRARDWRSHLVGATAALLFKPTPAVAQGLWNAFDARSWVSPQLAVSALRLDPLFSEEARTRIERAFAALSHTPPRRGIWQRLSGAKPRPARWESNVDAKGIAALFYLCGLEKECDPWFGAFKQDARVLRLVESSGEQGDQFARNWTIRLNQLGLPREFEG